MKTLLKLLGVAVGLLVLLVVCAYAYIQTRWDKTFDIPEPALVASEDPAVIEHGAYLVFGPAHCGYCHAPKEAQEEVTAGLRVPLSGGYQWQLPPGTLTATNLTPDAATGIGSWTDGQIARVLRNNVRHDGRAVFPMKEYEHMADDDIVAIISYLRSQEAVAHETPDIQLNLLGKAVYALSMEPRQPSETPASRAPAEEATRERGQYLADSVAMCKGCHTNRDLRTGELTGEPYAGGFEMALDHQPGMVIVTPNLTPDADTGGMAGWDEETFVDRFKNGGGGPEGSHMPWSAYAKMSETDLRAMWKYFESLSPVKNDVGESIRPATTG